MTKEQRFYKALQDVFIGAKIEGTGGFVNLMRIKSNYYSKIEQILKEDVKKALEKYPSFRDELFDKLYSFFSRYFTESGSIYFNSTPFHNNVYEKIYTNDKDVILFWKTQMLYYVKTDRIFRSLPVEFPSDRGVPASAGGVLKFYFDASKIENKRANEKRSLIFELDNIKEDQTIVFNVLYSEKGTKTKTDEILKAIKKKGIAITEEELERAFRVFEKQSEVDFFINKNAKAFLQEQFKLWSYQYFWEGTPLTPLPEGNYWSADRVNELQILKDIAFKIIDFISQFEDELVKIWNKPKFVKNANYVITLDRIVKKFPFSEGVAVRRTDGVVKWNELPFNPNLKERAKELRKAGNLSEVLLWEQVKNKQLLGLDFDRQKIIGNYIVDFYCKGLGVVVEIDGISHDGKVEYDKERDAYLKSLGLKVIHISDLDVKKNLNSVIELLKSELKTPRQATPATPLKEGNDTPSLQDTPLQEGNLLEKIFNHKNIQEQIKEWNGLGIVEENFKVKDVFEIDLMGKHLAEKYEHLPIDTKYFKDLELEILSQFEDLDKSLDGWLIKSENYQALNTILPKFKEKVQTIYIDPPFNLDSSDQFLYRTNYKDANWATLLENRLRIAKDWLNEKGSIFVRCDYNGNWIVRCLMDDNFNNNLRNEIAIKRTRTLKGESGRFHTAWETLYFYGKSEDIIFKGFRKLKPESDWEWVEMHLPGTRKDEDLLYRNFFGKRIKAPAGRRWALSQEALDDAISKGLVKMDEKTGMPKFLTKWETLGSNWTDISGYSPTHGFTTENSEELLQRVIESTSNKGDLVMDFFLGSGTTTAVSHKLGRKWIGVEMGEHFYSVVLPRMKKVLAYDKSGISKEVKEYQGGGFFKYYELEQYEESLANCIYENHDLLIAGNKSPYEQYVFLKDEKMLRALDIDYENNKVKVDLPKLYDNIDIAETLSNLTGKWIKRITPRSSNTPLKEGNNTPSFQDTPLKEGNYEIEFEDGTKINTKDLDYKLIKPLIWWE